MKFFTFEAYDEWYGVGIATGLDNSFRQYQVHLNSMRGVLPQSILELAVLGGVDDGLVVRVKHDLKRNLLKFVIRCGHLQMGYYDLELTYIGVCLAPEDKQTLQKICVDNRLQYCDLAFHELDIGSNGGVEHRFLFHYLDWSISEQRLGRLSFAIGCKELHWKALPRKSRRILKIENRYHATPAN